MANGNTPQEALRQAQDALNHDSLFSGPPGSEEAMKAPDPDFISTPVVIKNDEKHTFAYSAVILLGWSNQEDLKLDNIKPMWWVYLYRATGAFLIRLLAM